MTNSSLVSGIYGEKPVPCVVGFKMASLRIRAVKDAAISDCHCFC